MIQILSIILFSVFYFALAYFIKSQTFKPSVLFITDNPNPDKSKFRGCRVKVRRLDSARYIRDLLLFVKKDAVIVDYTYSVRKEIKKIQKTCEENRIKFLMLVNDDDELTGVDTRCDIIKKTPAYETDLHGWLGKCA
jgi:hypothetical protein